MRSYRQPIPHIPRTHTGYAFPRGTTAILAEAQRKFKEDVVVAPAAATAMSD